MALELAAFLEIAEAMNSVRELIEDQMGDILRRMGSVHVGAAIQALEDRKRSKHPEREITVAVSNLQAAHKFFEEASHEFKTKTVAPRYISSMEDAIEVSILLAASYSYLREGTLCAQYTKQGISDLTRMESELNALAINSNFAAVFTGPLLTLTAMALFNAHIAKTRVKKIPEEKARMQQFLDRL